MLTGLKHPSLEFSLIKSIVSRRSNESANTNFIYKQSFIYLFTSSVTGK